MVYRRLLSAYKTYSFSSTKQTYTLTNRTSPQPCHLSYPLPNVCCFALPLAMALLCLRQRQPSTLGNGEADIHQHISDHAEMLWYIESKTEVNIHKFQACSPIHR